MQDCSHYNDHINSDADPSEVLSLVKNAGRVVVAAFVNHVPGREVMSHGKATIAVGLSGESAEFLDDIVATAPRKTVVVALGSPYLILNYTKIPNHICTYSLTSTAEVAATKALFGEIQNHGRPSGDAPTELLSEASPCTGRSGVHGLTDRSRGPYRYAHQLRSAPKRR